MLGSTYVEGELGKANERAAFYENENRLSPSMLFGALLMLMNFAIGFCSGERRGGRRIMSGSAKRL